MMDRLKQVLDGVSFHRGLALGALVGAAIAGSTLWSRVRGGRHQPARSADEHGAREQERSNRSH
jgi:hypothetical protein